MATTRIMPLHVGKDRTESAEPLPMLLKSNRKDSFFPFRYWRFALQKHGSDQKVPVVSVLYSFGLPAFFALKQLNHQSA